MTILNGKELSKLKEEYSQAVVENMTGAQARAYLTQIVYNDVAVADGLELSMKIRRQFGDEMYDSMVAEITKA